MDEPVIAKWFTQVIAIGLTVVCTSRQPCARNGWKFRRSSLNSWRMCWVRPSNAHYRGMVALEASETHKIWATGQLTVVKWLSNNALATPLAVSQLVAHIVSCLFAFCLQHCLSPLCTPPCLPKPPHYVTHFVSALSPGLCPTAPHYATHFVSALSPGLSPTLSPTLSSTCLCWKFQRRGFDEGVPLLPCRQTLQEQGA